MKGIGCLTYIVIFIINLTVGTWSIIEILSWFDKSIPDDWKCSNWIVCSRDKYSSCNSRMVNEIIRSVLIIK